MTSTWLEKNQFFIAYDIGNFAKNKNHHILVLSILFNQITTWLGSYTTDQDGQHQNVVIFILEGIEAPADVILTSTRLEKNQFFIAIKNKFPHPSGLLD